MENKKQKIRFGIFPRLLITMLAIATIPLATNWWINYQSSLQRLTNQVEQLLAAQSDGIVTYVDTWMEMNLKVLRQVALLDDVISMDKQKQFPILKSVANEYKWVYLVYTIAPDGNDVGRSDGGPSKFYGDRNYFQQAMSGASFSAEVVLGRTNLKPTLGLAVPIYNNEQKVVGVIARGSSIADVSDNIVNAKIGKSGYAYLLDDKGKVIAHQKEEFTKVLADFSKHAAFTGLGQASKKKVSFNDEVTGKKIFSYVQKTRYGWILVVQQDYDEAYAPVNEANEKALVVFGVTLIFVFIISFWVASRLSRPILNLVHIADSISRGELNAKVNEVKRSDEIGELARAIERLGTSMKIAIERLKHR